MTTRTVTSLALAAGCAIALAIPAAQAQTLVVTNGPEPTPGDFTSSAMRNNAESREYMRLLQSNWNFREARIREECGPLTDMRLRQNCMASFDAYTPFTGSTRLAGNAWYPPNRQTYTAPPSLSENMMTGSSMPTTTPMTGTMGWSAPPEAGTDATVLPYAPGYSAIPPGATYYPYSSGQPYGVTNYYQPDRTYAGQVTGFPPSGTPFYPGPRPAGPKSGGGSSGGGGGAGGAGGM
jgi:hypothetical protein